MGKIFATACLVLAIGGVAAAEGSDASKLNDRIAAAHDVLHELMATPDRGFLWRSHPRPSVWRLSPALRRVRLSSAPSMARESPPAARRKAGVLLFSFN